MKAQLVMECENGCARVKLERLLRPSANLGQRDREQHPHQARTRRVASQLANEDVIAEQRLGKGRQVKMQLHKMQIFTPLHTHQAQLGELSPTIFHP